MSLKAAPSALHVDAVLGLLESVRLSGAALDARVAQARSIEFWRGLAPGLRIEGPPAPELEMLDPAGDVPQGALERFREEGYLSFANLVPLPVVRRMREAVDHIERHDLPAVFAWVFDEFWRVPRLPAVTGLFAQILGSDYQQTPYVWVHVVPGRRGARGWPPHVDHAGPDARLTLWIPLTEASVETGCMAVMPKHLVPVHIAGTWYDKTPVAMSDVMALLHATRPLPVSPGAALCWDAGVLHWGLERQGTGEPRISFSMEFTAAGQPEAAIPVLSPSLPSFAERIGFIANALITYDGAEPRTSRYVALARALVGTRPGV